MKILFLYRYIPGYDYDNHLHMMFAEAISKTPGCELIAYGPNLHFGYPSLVPIPWNPGLSIQQIHNSFNFDAILICTKSRMFEFYDPHHGKAEGCWQPSGWDSFKTTRIVLEEDYHYETSDNWYKQCNIDVILQRHYSQSLRQDTVRMIWFPFSVDTNMFHPKNQFTCRHCNKENPESRINRICFSGTTNAGAYAPRNKAIEILKKGSFIDSFQRKEKVGYNYIECLQSYVSHLSCSSTYGLTSAKMFEIMASGSVLLTNENPDLPLLFEKDTYFTYKVSSHLDSLSKTIYTIDEHDLLQKARHIINMDRSNIVQKSLENIRTRHSHPVRIQQLIKVINEAKKGKINEIQF